MSLKWSGVEGGSRQYDMSAVQTHNRQVFVAFQEKIRHIPLFQLNSRLMQKKNFSFTIHSVTFHKAAAIMSQTNRGNMLTAVVLRA